MPSQLFPWNQDSRISDVGTIDWFRQWSYGVAVPKLLSGKLRRLQQYTAVCQRPPAPYKCSLLTPLMQPGNIAPLSQSVSGTPHSLLLCYNVCYIICSKSSLGYSNTPQLLTFRRCVIADIDIAPTDSRRLLEDTPGIVYSQDSEHFIPTSKY